MPHPKLTAIFNGSKSGSSPFSGHSHISPEDFQALMLKKDDMAADVGSVLYGEEAVQVGLIDQVGGLADGLACLHRQIRERKPQE